jgi:hypothetical protein
MKTYEAKMDSIKRFKCDHEFVTISNFYGDYINYISSGFPIYRSRQKCIRCGKERLSEYLGKDCKIINDGKT